MDQADTNNNNGGFAYRRVDLTSEAGRTVSNLQLNVNSATPAGTWQFFYFDMVLVSKDGTVHPIYTGESGVSLSGSGTSGVTNVSNQVSYYGSGPSTGSFPAAIFPGSTTNYYHADHLGSARLMTSFNGYPVWSATFLPFGQEWNPQLTTNHYKFTGKERDSESGLDNFGARYDSSSTGRFMSPDPSNLSVDFWIPQSWNRYGYALNNPLGIVDSNGLWPWYIHDQIIDQAFPGLSKSQLQNLKQASANVDKDQSPEGAYKHGMSNGQAVNTTSAPEDTSEYIDNNEESAEQIQADWVASGHTGIAPAALTAFGNALHTVTDKTSPAHEGYQRWYGVRDLFGVTAAYHFIRESNISDARRAAAVAAARRSFSLTFGFLALQNATDGLTPHVTVRIGPATPCGQKGQPAC
jgi:RHS repeat-associated protein